MEQLSIKSVGGGEGDALDLRRKEDRSKLAEAIRRGWAVDPARKARYLAALDDLVRSYDGSDRASVIIGANRIYQMEQAAALKDLHQMEHDARLDEGKATERVDTEPVVLVHMAPPDKGA
jgi:hypothetical protein